MISYDLYKSIRVSVDLSIDDDSSFKVKDVKTSFSNAYIPLFKNNSSIIFRANHDLNSLTNTILKRMTKNNIYSFEENHKRSDSYYTKLMDSFIETDDFEEDLELFKIVKETSEQLLKIQYMRSSYYIA